YPNSRIFPLANKGVIESSPFQDTIAGVPQTGLRLVLKNNQGAVLWEKKLPNTGYLPNLSCDSTGILLVTGEIVDAVFNWGYENRAHWKYQIVDLDWNGGIRFIDTSLKRSSVGSDYPRIRRVDSNRIAISIVSDSAVSFRNQTFYTTSGVYHSFDSWLLFLDRSQTGTQFSYVQNVELCGIDSLQLPVLGFPPNSGPYRVELSDGNGSFASPTTLAQGNQNRFNLHFPVSLPDGDRYTLRVFSEHLNAFNPGYKVTIRFRSTIDPPVVTTVGQLNVCQGKSVKFMASSPNRWSWYNKPDPADTLSVWYNTQVQAVSSFGSCKAFSQEVTVRFIEHHVSLPENLQNTVCLPSGAIQLSVLDSGGHWFGEYVDSTGFQFNPGNHKDTSILYYQNHQYANCPIDTTFTIIQAKIPALPFVADSVICTGEQIIFQKDTLSGIHWTGLNVQNSIFSATAAGTYYVQFSKTENGCFNQDNAKILVLESGGNECSDLDTLPELGVVIPSTFCTRKMYTAYLKNQKMVMNPGAQFLLEISRLEGEFNPIILATSQFNSPFFEFVVKDTLSQGTYRLRLRTTNPDTVVSFPDRFIHVNQSPSYPFIHHSGPQDFCVGQGEYQTKWFYPSQLPLFWQLGDSIFQADTMIPIPGIPYKIFVENGGCISPKVNFQVNIVPKQTARLTSSEVICVPVVSTPLTCNISNPTWSGPYVNSNLKRIYPPNQDDTLFVRLQASYGAGNSCPIDTQLRIYTYRKPTVPTISHAVVCSNSGLFTLPFSEWKCIWTGPGIVDSVYYQPPPNQEWTTLTVNARNYACQVSGLLRIHNLDSLDPQCITANVSPEVQLQELSVFPNPGHERIRLDFPAGFRPPFFLIRDICGKQIGRFDGWEESIPVSTYPSGLYWICAPGYKPKAVEIR
ncbi:MAG TPA: hypothetical protein PK509_08375, partial [Catalimonadaceae bacterium]|nr:hypothetical protein [Catalimonadaceae bacterium]